MDTRVVKAQDEDGLRLAAELLVAGQVVAFPTETVYGLGANALDSEAVARIFIAKGRPADNPLIVHVAEKKDIAPLVKTITPIANCLIQNFMPGPITLVMQKSDLIPDIVTAGLDTVGIRIPQKDSARKLISFANLPVAAPSANRSGRPSPTKAEHVLADLKGRIPFIVDDGACDLGLESTVVDVSGHRPVILRPGAITKAMIYEVLAKEGISFEEIAAITASENPRAPGMKYRHYAPKAPVEILMPDAKKFWDYGSAIIQSNKAIAQSTDPEVKCRYGVFCSTEEKLYWENKENFDLKAEIVYYEYGLTPDIKAASKALFAGLRSLDKENLSRIFVPGFEGDDLEEAYMNRLTKAAETTNSVQDKESPRHKMVLFVCSANTCRSPMAEAIFNALVQEKAPLGLENLSGEGVELRAQSAGFFGGAPSPAEAFAVLAVKELYGIDLKSHRSQQVTEKLLQECELIFGVTQQHAELLRQHFPLVKEQIFSFTEYIKSRNIEIGESTGPMGMAEVADPYGYHANVYERTADFLHSILDTMWDSILTDLALKEKFAK